MPELPGVQVFKEYIDATGLHRSIDDVHLSSSRMVEGVSPRTVRRRLRGRGLASTRRHGKHLFVEITGDGSLRLHVGMTGFLRYYEADSADPEYARLRLDFANGFRLAYCSKRTLGTIGLVDDVDDFVEDLRLGPDPLSERFDVAAFREALAGRRASIKSTLMNQHVLAGLGNIYTDEILFQAGLHRKAHTGRLRGRTMQRLYRTMHRVPARAIGARAGPSRMPGSWLLRHRSEGAKCPRCGGPLRRIRVSGRTTYYCPHDQRARR